jgi:hypothetical protein
VAVRGNVIHGFTGPAVELSQGVADETKISVSGNEIIDCGRTANPTARAGLNFVSNVRINSLIVRDNVVRKSDSSAMAVGMQGTSFVSSATIAGNVYEGLDADLSWSEGPENGKVMLGHVGSGNPIADHVPASFGSTWTNPFTEDLWCKRRNGDSADGWVRQR